MSNARRGRASPAPSVEIVIESALWKADPTAKTTVRRAVRAAAHPQEHAAEIAVLLTDDQSIRALNRQWRGHDEATNVLSFPPAAAAHGDGVLRLGDIVIAYETTATEAAAEGKSFRDHLAHLAVHGTLHLVGYDHESHDEAEIMESLERRILARLGVPDPYARDAKA
jgi:probable rRNA maturation factor